MSDYRRTKCYQYIARTCTKDAGPSEIATYPHRDSLGVPGRSSHPLKLYGTILAQEFVTLEKSREYLPHTSDISDVQQTLYLKRRPAELVLEVMDLTEYEPRRQLKAQHNPFHPENRKELEKYLKHCWQILVRCEMVASALGVNALSRNMIAGRILDLYGASDDPGAEMQITGLVL